MPVLTIEYPDFQDVQLIHDRMNAAKYILNSNTGICEILKERLLRSPETDLFAEELRLQSNRADNLLERTKSGSTLVRQTWAGDGPSLTPPRCKTSYHFEDSIL
jgi:hypothetical protein